MSECKCVRCVECHGTGNVEVATGSYPEWDLEPCDECEGSGYSEICASCDANDDDDRDYV